VRAIEAAIYANSWDSSRLYWVCVRNMVDRLETINTILLNGSDWLEQKRQPRAKTIISDPTAAAAIRHQAALLRLEYLEKERNAIIDDLGGALILIDGIRTVLGHKYADVIELRYIDRFKWAEIAGEMNITAVHARRIERITHDWIDSHGWAALIVGKGKAEE